MKYKCLMFVILAILCIGCRGGRDLPVRVVHDTIVKTEKEVKLRVDSVYHYVNKYVYQNGDTVREVDSVMMLKIEIRNDTIVDSVYVKVPEEVFVEKEVKVRGFFWWTGLVAFILVIGYVIYIVFEKTRKRRWILPD